MSLISRLYRLFTGEPAVVKTTGAGTQADPAIPHVIVEATQVEWSAVQNKPTAFIPEDHTHPWASIYNKPIIFPPEAHTHVAADITDLVPGGGPVDWAEITGKPSSFPSAPEIQGLGSNQIMRSVTRPNARPDASALQDGDIWLNQDGVLLIYHSPFWWGPPFSLWGTSQLYNSGDRECVISDLPTGVLLSKVKAEFITYSNDSIDYWDEIRPRLAVGDVYFNESVAPTLVNASSTFFDTNRSPARTLYDYYQFFSYEWAVSLFLDSDIFKKSARLSMAANKNNSPGPLGFAVEAICHSFF